MLSVSVMAAAAAAAAVAADPRRVPTSYAVGVDGGSLVGIADEVSRC